jgi:IS5 family transposase
MHQAPNLQTVAERLVEVEAQLSASAEQSGGSPDCRAIRPLLESLQEELDRLGEIDRQVAAWAGGTVELEREAAVAHENLALAHLALQSAREEDEAAGGYAMLFHLRDAAFHARRGLDQMRQLENDALQATRRLDRDENRREFLSG